MRTLKHDNYKQNGHNCDERWVMFSSVLIKKKLPTTTCTKCCKGLCCWWGTPAGWRTLWGPRAPSGLLGSEKSILGEWFRVPDIPCNLQGINVTRVSHSRNVMLLFPNPTQVNTFSQHHQATAAPSFPPSIQVDCDTHSSPHLPLTCPAPLPLST